MKKLELIREEKLFRLIPGRTRTSRLEASGVAVIDDSTVIVAFDNLNQIARIDLSLERSRRNRLWHTPSLGAGFEDIAADARLGSTFGLLSQSRILTALFVVSSLSTMAKAACGSAHGCRAGFKRPTRALRASPTRGTKAGSIC